MKMNRYLLVAVLVLTAATGWCFDLSVIGGGGFGLGLDKEVFGTEVHQGGLGDYDEYRYYFAGMGSGFQGVGGLELGFGPTFAFSLSYGYVQSPRLHLEGFDSQVFGTTPVDVFLVNNYYPADLTLRGRLQTGPVSFFFGAGPSMAGPPGRGVTTDTTGDEETVIETTYTIGWGYHGLTGLEVDLGRLFSLRFEVRGRALTVRPRDARIVSYTVNGVDQLDATYPDPVDREVIYVRDISEYLNDPVDPSDPAQELAFNISFDSVVFFLGVVVHLVDM